MGTGSDETTCGRASSLTNVTCAHALIWTCLGSTPDDLIVTVTSLADGLVGLPPPQELITQAANARKTRDTILARLEA